MVTIAMMICGAITIVFSVLQPICKMMMQNRDRHYEEKIKVYKALWIKKYYPEARSISMQVLYDNIEQLEPVYNAIGANAVTRRRYSKFTNGDSHLLRSSSY